MFIRSVKLSNIRSYTEEEIEFKQGSTLLSGDIGSGKTTILLAIEFCLFGMSKDLQGNALLRNGANEGSIELEFELDNKTIIIKRFLRKYKDGVKQAAGYMIIDGIKSDLTAQEIKAKVLELLGYPMTLLAKSKNLMYRYTVYTQQEDMKQILLDDKDYRVDTLRKIFGIDRYKNIRENTLIYTKHLKNIVSRLQGRIEDIDAKTEQLAVKTILLQKLTNTINSLNKDVASLDTENKKQSYKEAEKRLNDFNKTKNKLDINETKLDEKNKSQTKIMDDIVLAKKAVKAIESKLSLFKLEKPTAMTAEELNDLISRCEEQHNAAIKDNNILTEKASHIKTRIEELNKEIEQKSEKTKDLKFKRQAAAALEQELMQKQSLKASISSLNAEIQTLALKLKEAEVNAANSEKTKKQITELSKCPTCLQAVPKEHKATIHEAHLKTIAELSAAVQNYSKEKQLKSADFTKQSRLLEELQAKESVLSGMQAEVKSAEYLCEELAKKQKIIEQFKAEIIAVDEKLALLNKQDLNDIKAEIAKNKALLRALNDFSIKLKEQQYLQEQLAEKTAAIEALGKTNSLLTAEITALLKECDALKQDMKQFENIEELYAKHKQAYEAVQDKQNNLLLQKASVEKERDVTAEQAAELQKEIKQKQADKAKIEYYNQLQNWLDGHFISLMGVIERNVMFSIYQQFDDLFKDWFNTLMENENISVRLDEEFSPIIEQNGYDIDYSNLSGGERTAVALAYRLALNKVVNEVQSQIKTKELLILDEPTDGFSTEQLDKVRLVLDELHLQQVIIVSHETKIESFVENVIKIEKSEHVSKVIA